MSETAFVIASPARARPAAGPRLVGAHLRVAVAAWLAEEPGRTRAALVRALGERLARAGRPAHPRTLHRYLSGDVATVPPHVATELAALVRMQGEPDPAAFSWEEVAPLAQAWLALHPEASKRTLAVRLGEILLARGAPRSVDHLQSVLAGRHARVGAAVTAALRDLLATDGVQDGASAARIARERRFSVDGRALEPAARLVELCEAWRRAHPRASGRQLACRLHDRAKARGLHLGFAQLERCVNGRTRLVRRAVRELLEELLAEGPPSQPAPSAVRPRLPAAQAAIRDDHELLLAWRDRGDAAALDALVRRYLPIVKLHARGFRGYALGEQDLVQEGVVGLLQAIRRFDPSRGVRLSTYARYWIRAMLYELAFTQKSIVRFGHRRHSRVFFGLREAQGRLEAKIGPHGPVHERLAEDFGTSPEAVALALGRLWGRDVSLDEPAAGTDRPRLDGLTDAEAAPDESLERERRAHTVRQAIEAVRAELSPRDARILERRLLADEDASTLAELGEEMGVSRERVRQIESKICAMLRERLAGEHG